MSKSYKKVRLKKDRVYSIEQLSAEYSVTANTVSNWVCEGLMPSDSQTPFLFRGATVKVFHERRRVRARRKLQPGQFRCRGCQTDVFPAIKTVKDFQAKNGKHMFTARCPECSFKIQKISGKTDRDMIENCLNPNTPTVCLHEENPPIRGGIVANQGKNVQNLWCQNDRIIHKWQTYAGRYCEKTIVRHLAAIRFFEGNCGGKPFSKLTTVDFAGVRDTLITRAKGLGEDRLSASSIRHIVSHLITFFGWLRMQDGFRRLPRDFAGYLKLPKAVLAQSASVMRKDYPSISEAEQLLNAMPFKSLADLRARALFALAFLGALRADTLISLRIKHFDRERRLILQDASLVRAKAGKSINVFWFPLPISYEMAVVDWVERLQRLRFTEDDALFPDQKYLKLRTGFSDQVPIMTTTIAVTKAFAVACRDIDTKYTPHSAKHTIGAQLDILALTREERRAWSLNMGHENEQITERHYGIMSDDHRFEVLEEIGSKRTIDPRDLSEHEKAKLFDCLMKALGDNS